MKTMLINLAKGAVFGLLWAFISWITGVEITIPIGLFTFLTMCALGFSDSVVSAFIESFKKGLQKK